MAEHLAQLTAMLQEHAVIQGLVADIRDGGQIHVSGVRKAAAAPLLAAIHQPQSGPQIVIVATAEDARRMYEDLQVWAPQRAVYHFAANDIIPYEPMSASRESTTSRLEVLHALQHGGDVLVVTSVRALFQHTIAPHDLQVLTTEIRLGERYDPLQLMHQWHDMGYRVQSAVSEPGEMNRRGGIVDIFPLGHVQPLRIEFFGDEIDDIRVFDPLTQRSVSTLKQVTIGPAFEYAHQRRAQVVEWLQSQSYASLRDEAKQEWQSLIERLHHDEHFEGQALLAPFFAHDAHLASLLDYVDAATPIFVVEPVFVVQTASEYVIQHQQRRMQHIEAGELPDWYPDVVLAWRTMLRRGNAVHLAHADLAFAELLPQARIYECPATMWQAVDLYGGRLKDLVADIQRRLDRQEMVWLVTPQAARLHEMVQDTGADMRYLQVVQNVIDSGWQSALCGVSVFSDAEIFGWTQRRSVAKSQRSQRDDQGMQDRAAFLRGLQVGDYVVHIEHGIALYQGMIRRTIDDVERDYLNLQYAGGDRLYVPVDQVDRVSRYIGAGDAEPTLTRLGTQEWERAKRKARKSVEDLTEELLSMYAKRSMSKGFVYAGDNAWQREFEAAFPYSETLDQLKAIADVKHDMESDQPMDRLVCGDVGFGKTEVALRAAFKAVQSHKQVAVLVPTTVLAQQHYETFSRRMAAYPINVALISRFRTAREQQHILDEVRAGKVDILIGTHRLLSNDVHFKDLGLLIVDEEQRFGVKHKERLKHLKVGIDVLTLTATPIPRTLHMSLAGIRDMSVIETPPEERMPVKTYLIQRDDKQIHEAIERELERDGQVYVVHNRVQSIYHLADQIQQLVPQARIGVGHGQLPEAQLERVMVDFYTGKTNVLVSTTIIENGLDVSTANTILIDNAPYYGLSQLYQLRGRVGRSSQRAYCYLMMPPGVPLTFEAHQRLQAIQEATELGAGFRIAMRDLEIRGAGNVLGAEQSGHIAAVGFDLYSRLLEQAVKTMKHRLQQQHVQTPSTELNGRPAPAPMRRVKVDERVLVTPLVTVDLPLNAFIPVDYIPDDQVRLSTYQHLAEAQTLPAVRGLRSMLRDRFGRPPDPVEHLLTWLHIKCLALQAGVPSVVASEQEYIIKLPDVHDELRMRLVRRFQRDTQVRIGPQFVRIMRRAVADEWVAKIVEVLEVIQPVTSQREH